MINILNFIKKYQLLILIILGMILYIPALSFGFVYDDVQHVLNNGYINGSTHLNIFDFFIPKFVSDAIYTPLTFIISWGTIKIFGINSFALHCVNIVFYIFSSVALFYLLKKITTNDSISFFAVVLYILHACHIECTAWICGLGYNISALFFFLSFLYFISAFDEDKKINYVFSVFFYCLAILSQPISVTLPAILFVWVYCFRRDKLKKSIPILYYIPFLLCYLFLFKNTVSNSYRFSDFVAHSFFDKLVAFGHYVFNSFLPLNVNPFYVSSSPLYLIVTIFVFIYLIYLLFKKDKKIDNNLLFFILFYLITLSPYLGIVFENMLLICDRYLLFASISSCVFISIFCFYLFEKLHDKYLLKYISFLFFVVIYFCSSFIYLPIWKDNESFWRYAYNENSVKDNIFLLGSYGTVLLNNGKYDEASELADRMIEKYPQFSEGYVTKIQARMALNDLNGSITVCSKFRDTMPEYYVPYLCFFDIYIALQDFDNASKCLDIAYNKAKEHNLYKYAKIYSFAQKRLILSYVNADPDTYIENFKIVSSNFSLLQDQGEFLKMMDKNDYKSRKEACLNYLAKYNTKYSKSVINLLNSLYMHETYKDNASNIMKSLLKDMNKAGDFFKNNKLGSAEQIYLSILSKDKYMIEAYYNLGILYFNTQRPEKAKEIFAKILEINPNDEQVKQFLNLTENSLK